MRDLKLKRLDTSYGKYGDTCAGLKNMLVTDLPIFNNDGTYYSRALKRTWIEVAGKTYEITIRSFGRTVETERKDNCDLFLYSLNRITEDESDCGEEVAKVLKRVVKLLPAEVQKKIYHTLQVHERCREQKETFWKMLKLRKEISKK